MSESARSVARRSLIRRRSTAASVTRTSQRSPPRLRLNRQSGHRPQPPRRQLTELVPNVETSVTTRVRSIVPNVIQTSRRTSLSRALQHLLTPSLSAALLQSSKHPPFVSAPNVAKKSQTPKRSTVGNAIKTFRLTLLRQLPSHLQDSSRPNQSPHPPARPAPSATKCAMT